SRSGLDYALGRGVPAARLFFIPNAVDTEIFQPSVDAFRPPVKLLAAGRLTREKRFDRFLEILHRVRCQQGLDVRGLLVGPTRADQELRPELERLAASLGLLPDGVEFLGSIA